MGDLEFIQGKVIAGDYFQESGNIDAVTDTIEFIVPTGKTAFLIEAKIVITGVIPNSGTAAATNKNAIEAELKIDTVTKDSTYVGVALGSWRENTGAAAGGSGGSGAGNQGDGKFNVLGLSLVGDGIKKIEIENTLDDGTAFATFSGYLIDT